MQCNNERIRCQGLQGNIDEDFTKSWTQKLGKGSKTYPKFGTQLNQIVDIASRISARTVQLFFSPWRTSLPFIQKCAIKL